MIDIEGKLVEQIEHIHSAQRVYPTLADGVTLTTAAGDWALGNFTEIIPAAAITSKFDIMEILVEDVDKTDKTYELVLYHSTGDVECGRARFAAASNKGGVPTVSIQTGIIPANSRVRAKLAIENGGSKIAKISIRYHLH